MDTEFNVRVYALCIEQNKILLLKEPFAGKIVVKLPGGGLEFGEGPVDCLKREFKEELNLEITDIEPFYIQKHYIPSAIHNNKQLLMLYFTCKIIDIKKLKILDKDITDVQWTSISKNLLLDLPADQEMYSFLINQLKI